MKISNLSTSIGLLAPLAAAGVIATGAMPAQAQIIGTADLNGKVEFPFSGPPLSAPPEFFFPQSTTCGLGFGCDFNVETSTGVLGFLTSPVLNSVNPLLQYRLQDRLSPVSGNVLPSLILPSSNGVTPDGFAGIAPNTAGFLVDFVASGTAAALAPNQRIIETLIPNVADFPEYAANGVPFLQLGAAGNPLYVFYFEQITDFLSDFSAAAGTVSESTIIGNINVLRFDCGTDDGSCAGVDLFGDAIANATFTIGNTETALNISVNLEEDIKVPEPTTLLGIAFATTAGALTLKRKKQSN